MAGFGLVSCGDILGIAGDGEIHCANISMPSLWETIEAVAVSLIAVSLIDKYSDQIDDAHDAMKGYLDFQMDVAEYYHKYYINTVNPQELIAIMYALNLNVVPPGTTNPFTTFNVLSKKVYSDAKRSAKQMLSGSCNSCMPVCDREYEIMAAISGVDSGGAEGESTLRRKDRLIAEKVKTILGAVNYTYKNPNHILGFVNGAINVQQNLINMAASGYNGALGMLGTGLGMLSNTLQQRSAANDQKDQQAQTAGTGMPE